MKREPAIFYLLALLMCQACHFEQTIPSIQPSFTFQISSRGSDDEKFLPEGSSILLNAEGGLSLENEIFTCQGNTWTSSQSVNWNNTQEATRMTALYPVYEDKTYSMSNLYDDKGLADVLIAQCSLASKEEIHLEFHHLFSLLTIHIEKELLENYQEIHLTTPTKVSHISPYDGTITLVEENHTAARTMNGSSEYSFLVPPAADLSLSLTLIAASGSAHEFSLSPHTFQNGIRYECHLVQGHPQPGIRTAEDLIAFSQLINGTYTGEKTWMDFGIPEGETMEFHLLNDIELTPENCDQLHPIGKSEDLSFKYIFNGNNHTLSNLILPDANTDEEHSGLFGFIHHNGTVKNINIDNASTISSPQCSYVGVIASKNMGTIDHCSVTGSTITSTNYGNIGLIASISTGTILNCYTQGNRINLKENSYGGAIASIAEGYVLNCYTRKNSISEKDSKSFTSSLVSASTNEQSLTIENCYIHHTGTNNRWGAAISYSNKVIVKHFYYNTGSFFYSSPTSSTSYSKARKYDASYCYNSTSIATLLDNWRSNEGTAQYPEFSFCSWGTADDGSPQFHED